MDNATLWGTPLSLYSGRARSYLIKARIPYLERTPTVPHYKEVVLPKAGGRAGIPTLELADGTVVRDGAAIVDHYESSSNHGFSPSTPKQRIVSRLFDVLGAEGLLRPAMHYRWNFPDRNLAFLRFHFGAVTRPGSNHDQRTDASMDRMRAACMGFGAVPETFDLVETLYHELLAKLDAHFAQQPYLLGGEPCVGDFGLIAPLYGHLGRDPEPLSIMQAKAIRLFRWVERMNRPEPDIGEFTNQDAEYLAEDEIPETLIQLLKQFAVDFVPETKAAAETINAWLADQASLPSGTQAERGVGMAKFTIRGTTINALAQPYRFYLLKRVQDEFAALDGAAKQEALQMLTDCNMAAILDIKLSRDITRQNNLEVWA